MKFNIKPGQQVKFVAKNKPRELVVQPIRNFEDMMGIVKTKKKFSKAAARKAYIKDLIAGKI